MAIVGAAGIEVRPDMRTWNRDVRKEVTGPHMSRIGHEGGSAVAGGFQRGAARITGFLGNVAKAGVATLVGATAASGAVGIRTAAQLETAQIAFETMLGSGEKARAFLGELQTFAAKTPFDLPGLQKSAQSLISIGIESDKVIPIMTTLGNVTSGMGTGAEGVQRATVAIQQMNAAGRIGAEDLNQLRDAGIPVFDLLTAATGKTTAQIAEMAGKGELGRKELEQLMSALESGKGLERFDGMMEKQSASLAGLWSTLKDTFSVGMAQAVQPALPLIKQGLGGAITFLSDRVVPAATMAMSELVGGVKAFAAAWRYNDGEVTSSGFPGFMERLAYVARQTFDEIRGGIRAFGAAWRYNDGEVTSSGFPGFMERAGYAARQVFDYLRSDGIPAARELWAQIKQLDFSGLAAALSGFAGSARETAPSLKQIAAEAGPQLQSVLDRTQQVLGFVADNIGLVTKAIPGLLVAFAGWKTLQAANNLLGRQSAIGMGLQVTSTLSLAASNRALAASQKSVAASQTTANVASNAGTATRSRMTVATIASTVAEKAKTAALKAGAIAQRALNLVMRANPLGIVLTAVTALVGGLVLLYNKNETVRRIVNRVWSSVRSAISGVVSWWTDKAWPSLRSSLGSFGSKVTSVYRDHVKPGFDKVKSVIAGTWDSARGKLNAFKDGLSSLGRRFRSVKDGISDTWSGIVRSVAGPIASVVRFVNDRFLGPLERAINKIPGVNVKLPTIPVPSVPSSGSGGSGGGRPRQALAGGGVILPGWSPGVDNMQFYSPQFGRLDLSGGEGIMVPEWVRAVGPKAIAAMNAAARAGRLNGVRGAMGFARGGVFPGRSGGSVGDTLSSAGRFVLDMLTNPGRALKRLADRLLSGIGGSWPAKGIVGLAKHAMSGLASHVKGLFSSGGSGGGSRPAKGLPWQTLWQMVKAAAPEAILTSAFRPGARTAGYGNTSMHALGRAIDVASSNMRATFMRIKGLLPWTELIHTPMRGLQMHNGRNYLETNPTTMRMHNDHIHAAFRRGGVVPLAPRLADSGAVLSPGDHWIRNRTNHAEIINPRVHDVGPSASDLRDLIAELEEVLEDAVEKGAYRGTKDGVEGRRRAAARAARAAAGGGGR
ncbi:tape measure protein [Serinicoccus sediminis]|uniref:tape measure protein n=1 Tax=Serinicoccus sediminis TaxID=2306021 RepID=UPI001021752E|nr:tape measure protein [Serinicoccus sediminis]